MEYTRFSDKITSARPVKHYMLTYQNSNITKKEFIKRFRIYVYPKGKSLEAFKVVEETHPTTGNKHLHAIIKCENSISPAQLRDICINAYGEYEIAKIHYTKVSSIKKADTYISKEDKEPYESASYKTSEKRTRTVKDEQSQRIQAAKARENHIKYLDHVYLEYIEPAEMYKFDNDNFGSLQKFREYALDIYDRRHNHV